MTSILTSVDGPVATITLNRPEVRNAVDGPMAAALRDAFVAAEDDPQVCVTVLHGAGGTFCAGADLSAVSDPARRHELDPEGGGSGPMGPTRLTLRKPVIAAVAGHAVAGGLELALLADVRVAEPDAVFGVFCRRWGVPLIDGGTARLPRVVGQGRALDMILTGRPVDAEEAFAMGLVNRLVGPGEALVAAQQMAREIAAFPQECLRVDRASALGQWDLALTDALRAEGAAGVPVVAAEGAAGAERFVTGEGRHGAF